MYPVKKPATEFARFSYHSIMMEKSLKSIEEMATCISELLNKEKTVYAINLTQEPHINMKISDTMADMRNCLLLAQIAFDGMEQARFVLMAEEEASESE